jgi:hypothetical protein
MPYRRPTVDGVSPRVDSGSRPLIASTRTAFPRRRMLRASVVNVKSDLNAARD